MSCKFSEIKTNKNNILSSRVSPNVIYNRFDLLYGDDYELYDIGFTVVPVKKIDDYLTVGLYLVDGNKSILSKFLTFLFNKYSDIKYIIVKHCYTNICKAKPYPYWHIKLPKTKEEFDNTLVSRVRYNTKWYPKKVNKDIGEYKIIKYEACEISPDIIKLYLQWKSLSHGFSWGGKAIDYIKNAGITHGYVMTITDKIYAIAFICDTGDNVYFENFSYDVEYNKYSLGMIIYYHIICDMIKNKKNIFYLSGGYLDYKKWYNGILSYTYSGKIKRHHSFWWHLKHLKF